MYNNDFEAALAEEDEDPIRSYKIPTLGRLFPDGTAIEQLRDSRLVLHKPDGAESVNIYQTVGHDTYEPRLFDNLQLEKLLRLPERTEDFGTVGDLAKGLSQAIATCVAVDAVSSLLLAAFVLSTWMVDCLPTAPVLNVWGPTGTENPLIEVLSCLCRRSLRLTEPTVRELLFLPDDLCPTIILKRPRQRTLTQLLALATERDFNILRAGKPEKLQCAIVVYTEEPFAEATLSLPLLEAADQCGALDKPKVQRLTQFPPRLLRYRLSQHLKVTDSRFDHPGFAPKTRVLARLLGACGAGDSDVQDDIVRALQRIDEAVKVEQSQRPAAAVLEALLVLCHEKKEAALVWEITKLANGVFVGRHDNLELSPKAVGGIMRSQLGLCPKRQGPGYELSLTGGGVTARIHRLAAAHHVLSMQKPTPNCAWCNDILAVQGDQTAGSG